MAILREFRCAAHGAFESKDGECPAGCSPRFVVQEIRTPPSHLSGKTKRSDHELRQLSLDYRMSDIPSAEEGESVMMALRKKPQFQPTWGEVNHAKPGWSQRGEVSPTVAAASLGVAPGVDVPSMKPILPGPQPKLIAPAYRPTLPT